MSLQLAIAHRTLAISEILDQILCYVAGESDLDALNLGLTCRACIETVLDTLWERATLVQIARAFPARVLIWSKSQETTEEKIVRCADSPT
jgi:hypothetical protein